MPYLNQIIATVWNAVPTIAITRKFSYRTTNIGLLIMSTFRTNAGDIILTSSKLHIRAIHHTLSEIGTKRLFSYQRIAVKRNCKGQKLLVEANGKLASILKHSFPYLIIHLLFAEISRALPISPLVTTDPFRWWGHYLFTPDHDSDTSLATLISHPSTEGIFASSRMSVEEKKKHSVQFSYRLNQIFYRSINFSHSACNDDSLLLIPKTNQPQCITAFYRNVTFLLSVQM